MKTLIFVHVAKTGGDSLRQALKGPPTVVIPHTAKLCEWGEKSRTATVAVGHIPYGLHNHIGDREYDYLTILRHPVERVLSKYYYTTNLAVRGDNVADFMTGQFSHALHNLMVKQLCGLHILNKIEMDEAHYEIALENLKTIKYIGFTRQLGELFDRVKTDYDLPGTLGHTNKTRNNRVEAVSQDEIDSILEYNQWDLKLFKEAQNL